MESISKGCVLPDGPIHLLIDSTGLKVFGAGEWLQKKHGAKARRTWKKRLWLKFGAKLEALRTFLAAGERGATRHLRVRTSAA